MVVEDRYDIRSESGGRPLQAPYLLTAAADGRGPGVTVVGDASTAVVELTPYGPWSSRRSGQVTDHLRLCFAGPSAAIIIDLQHLNDRDGASLPFWLAAWRQAKLEPSPVHLTFCLPATSMLSRRLRNQAPQPHVCASVAGARMAIAERISRADRLQVRLPPLSESVRAARDLVTQACRVWRLPNLLADGSLIMSELAANAVEHARTDFVATVTRSRASLQIAVRDGASHFPQLNNHPHNSLQQRGRGLRLVHVVAATWGAMPTRNGKVVWASAGLTPVDLSGHRVA